MTTKELISLVSAKQGSSKIDTEKTLSAILDTNVETLNTGKKVKLSCFGTFSVRTRKERNGVSPSTKKRIVIPAKEVVIFKASKKMK